jgi:MurNAc alpha-1-phosphate uridylyltransferase
MLPMAILAGGMATRLGHLTKETPKSLIEIAGRPFIDYQLRMFARVGFSQIVICVGNLSEKIIDFVGDGKEYGLEVKYSHDGAEQLGTGGAIQKALPLINSDFFVQYGDSFLDFSYKELEQEYKKNSAPCLMTVYSNQNNFDKSNVKILASNYIIYSKSEPIPEMTFIDYGCMVLNLKSFGKYSTAPKFDLSDYLEHVSESGLLRGYEVKNRFFEIGSKSGLNAFEEYVRSHPNEL